MVSFRNGDFVTICWTRKMVTKFVSIICIPIRIPVLVVANIRIRIDIDIDPRNKRRIILIIPCCFSDAVVVVVTVQHMMNIRLVCRCVVVHYCLLIRIGIPTARVCVAMTHPGPVVIVGLGHWGRHWAQWVMHCCWWIQIS
jgi:hypothetical protein